MVIGRSAIAVRPSGETAMTNVDASRRRWLATAALLALSGALAAAAILGPLVLGVIEWRISPNSLNQTYGADGAALVLLVPAGAAAAWLSWQRRRVSAPLAFGLGLASLYYGVASVLGADYVQYPGNNERFFLLFLVIIVLAWPVAAWGWSAMDANPPRPGRVMARTTATVFVLGGLALAVAWLVQLVTIAATGSLGQAAEAQAYRESPGAYWLVRIVDLGFIVPLAIGAGIGLWRDHPAAVKAAPGVGAFLTLQATSVLAMGTIMLARNDPTATPGLVVVLAPITLAMAGLTARLLGAYTRPRGGSNMSPPTPDRPASAASYVRPVPPS
jgi:hypothetical protein